MMHAHEVQSKRSPCKSCENSRRSAFELWLLTANVILKTQPYAWN